MDADIELLVSCLDDLVAAASDDASVRGAATSGGFEGAVARSGKRPRAAISRSGADVAQKALQTILRLLRSDAVVARLRRSSDAVGAVRDDSAARPADHTSAEVCWDDVVHNVCVYCYKLLEADVVSDAACATVCLCLDVCMCVLTHAHTYMPTSTPAGLAALTAGRSEQHGPRRSMPRLRPLTDTEQSDIDPEQCALTSSLRVCVRVCARVCVRVSATGDEHRRGQSLAQSRSQVALWPAAQKVVSILHRVFCPSTLALFSAHTHTHTQRALLAAACTPTTAQVAAELAVRAQIQVDTASSTRSAPSRGRPAASARHARRTACVPSHRFAQLLLRYLQALPVAFRIRSTQPAPDTPAASTGPEQTLLDGVMSEPVVRASLIADAVTHWLCSTARMRRADQSDHAVSEITFTPVWMSLTMPHDENVRELLESIPESFHAAAHAAVLQAASSHDLLDFTALCAALAAAIRLCGVMAWRSIGMKVCPVLSYCRAFLALPGSGTPAHNAPHVKVLQDAVIPLITSLVTCCRAWSGSAMLSSFPFACTSAVRPARRRTPNTTLWAASWTGADLPDNSLCQALVSMPSNALDGSVRTVDDAVASFALSLCSVRVLTVLLQAQDDDAASRVLVADDVAATDRLPHAATCAADVIYLWHVRACRAIMRALGASAAASPWPSDTPTAMKAMWAAYTSCTLPGSDKGMFGRSGTDIITLPALLAAFVSPTTLASCGCPPYIAALLMSALLERHPDAIPRGSILACVVTTLTQSLTTAAAAPAPQFFAHLRAWKASLALLLNPTDAYRTAPASISMPWSDSTVPRALSTDSYAPDSMFAEALANSAGLERGDAASKLNTGRDGVRLAHVMSAALADCREMEQAALTTVCRTHMRQLVSAYDTSAKVSRLRAVLDTAACLVARICIVPKSTNAPRMQDASTLAAVFGRWIPAPKYDVGSLHAQLTIEEAVQLAQCFASVRSTPDANALRLTVLLRTMSAPVNPLFTDSAPDDQWPVHVSSLMRLRGDKWHCVISSPGPLQPRARSVASFAKESISRVQDLRPASAPSVASCLGAVLAAWRSLREHLSLDDMPHSTAFVLASSRRRLPEQELSRASTNDEAYASVCLQALHAHLLDQLLGLTEEPASAVEAVRMCVSGSDKNEYWAQLASVIAKKGEDWELSVALLQACAFVANGVLELYADTDKAFGTGVCWVLLLAATSCCPLVSSWVTLESVPSAWVANLVTAWRECWHLSQVSDHRGHPLPAALTSLVLRLCTCAVLRLGVACGADGAGLGALRVGLPLSVQEQPSLSAVLAEAAAVVAKSVTPSVSQSGGLRSFSNHDIDDSDDDFQAPSRSARPTGYKDGDSDSLTSEHSMLDDDAFLQSGRDASSVRASCAAHAWVEITCTLVDVLAVGCVRCAAHDTGSDAPYQTVIALLHATRVSVSCGRTLSTGVSALCLARIGEASVGSAVVRAGLHVLLQTEFSRLLLERSHHSDPNLVVQSLALVARSQHDIVALHSVLASVWAHCLLGVVGSVATERLRSTAAAYAESFVALRRLLETASRLWGYNELPSSQDVTQTSAWLQCVVTDAWCRFSASSASRTDAALPPVVHRALQQLTCRLFPAEPLLYRTTFGVDDPWISHLPDGVVPLARRVMSLPGALCSDVVDEEEHVDHAGERDNRYYVRVAVLIAAAVHHADVLSARDHSACLLPWLDCVHSLFAHVRPVEEVEFAVEEHLAVHAPAASAIAAAPAYVASDRAGILRLMLTVVNAALASTDGSVHDAVCRVIGAIASCGYDMTALLEPSELLPAHEAVGSVALRSLLRVTEPNQAAVLASVCVSIFRCSVTDRGAALASLIARRAAADGDVRQVYGIALHELCSQMQAETPFALVEMDVMGTLMALWGWQQSWSAMSALAASERTPNLFVQYAPMSCATVLMWTASRALTVVSSEANVLITPDQLLTGLFAAPGATLAVEARKAVIEVASSLQSNPAWSSVVACASTEVRRTLLESRMTPGELAPVILLPLALMAAEGSAWPQPHRDRLNAGAAVSAAAASIALVYDEVSSPSSSRVQAGARVQRGVESVCRLLADAREMSVGTLRMLPFLGSHPGGVDLGKVMRLLVRSVDDAVDVTWVVRTLQRVIGYEVSICTSGPPHSTDTHGTVRDMLRNITRHLHLQQEAVACLPADAHLSHVVDAVKLCTATIRFIVLSCATSLLNFQTEEVMRVLDACSGSIKLCADALAAGVHARIRGGFSHSVVGDFYDALVEFRPIVASLATTTASLSERMPHESMEPAWESLAQLLSLLRRTANDVLSELRSQELCAIAFEQISELVLCRIHSDLRVLQHIADPAQQDDAVKSALLGSASWAGAPSCHAILAKLAQEVLPTITRTHPSSQIHRGQHDALLLCLHTLQGADRVLLQSPSHVDFPSAILSLVRLQQALKMVDCALVTDMPVYACDCTTPAVPRHHAHSIIAALDAGAQDGLQSGSAAVICRTVGQLLASALTGGLSTDNSVSHHDAQILSPCLLMPWAPNPVMVWQTSSMPQPGGWASLTSETASKWLRWAPTDADADAAGDSCGSGALLGIVATARMRPLRGAAVLTELALLHTAASTEAVSRQFLCRAGADILLRHALPPEADAVLSDEFSFLCTLLCELQLRDACCERTRGSEGVPVDVWRALRPDASLCFALPLLCLNSLCPADVALAAAVRHWNDKSVSSPIAAAALPYRFFRTLHTWLPMNTSDRSSRPRADKSMDAISLRAVNAAVLDCMADPYMLSSVPSDMLRLTASQRLALILAVDTTAAPAVPAFVATALLSAAHGRHTGAFMLHALQASDAYVELDGPGTHLIARGLLAESSTLIPIGESTHVVPGKDTCWAPVRSMTASVGRVQLHIAQAVADVMRGATSSLWAGVTSDSVTDALACVFAANALARRTRLARQLSVGASVTNSVGVAFVHACHATAGRCAREGSFASLARHHHDDAAIRNAAMPGQAPHAAPISASPACLADVMAVWVATAFPRTADGFTVASSRGVVGVPIDYRDAAMAALREGCFPCAALHAELYALCCTRSMYECAEYVQELRALGAWTPAIAGVATEPSDACALLRTVYGSAAAPQHDRVALLTVLDQHRHSTMGMPVMTASSADMPPLAASAPSSHGVRFVIDDVWACLMREDATDSDGTVDTAAALVATRRSDADGLSEAALAFWLTARREHSVSASLSTLRQVTSCLPSSSVPGGTAFTAQPVVSEAELACVYQQGVVARLQGDVSAWSASLRAFSWNQLLRLLRQAVSWLHGDEVMPADVQRYVQSAWMLLHTLDDLARVIAQQEMTVTAFTHASTSRHNHHALQTSLAACCDAHSVAALLEHIDVDRSAAASRAPLPAPQRTVIMQLIVHIHAGLAVLSGDTDTWAESPRLHAAVVRDVSAQRVQARRHAVLDLDTRTVLELARHIGDAIARGLHTVWKGDERTAAALIELKDAWRLSSHYRVARHAYTLYSSALATSVSPAYLALQSAAEDRARSRDMLRERLTQYKSALAAGDVDGAAKALGSLTPAALTVAVRDLTNMCDDDSRHRAQVEHSLRSCMTTSMRAYLSVLCSAGASFGSGAQPRSVVVTEAVFAVLDLLQTVADGVPLALQHAAYASAAESAPVLGWCDDEWSRGVLVSWGTDLLSVPATAFLAALPQITARLGEAPRLEGASTLPDTVKLRNGDVLVPSHFQSTWTLPSMLECLLTRVAVKSPHAIVGALLGLALRGASSSSVRVSAPDSRAAAARALLLRLQQLLPSVKPVVSAMDFFARALVSVGEFRNDKRERGRTLPLSRILLPPSASTNGPGTSVPEAFLTAGPSVLQHVPIPVQDVSLAVLLSPPGSGPIVHVQAVHPEYQVAASGLSMPKFISMLGSDGRVYRAVVKSSGHAHSSDDLRQDAVMMQAFHLLNAMLACNARTRQCSARLRTYAVQPLTSRCGVLGFVDHAIAMGSYLCDPPWSARERYGAGNPAELRQRLDDAFAKYKRALDGHAQGTVTEAALQGALQGRHTVFKDVLAKSHPTLHRFFLDFFPDATAWFRARQRYAVTCAVASMVGYILGIGDRHANNLLLDSASGECVHIDFGVAFEQGRLLPTPETVPFRLTRDVMDALGPAGVHGSFEAVSTATLACAADHARTLLVLIAVILHDPLLRWSITPERARKWEADSAASNAVAPSASVAQESAPDMAAVSKRLVPAISEPAVAAAARGTINATTLRVLWRCRAKLDGSDIATLGGQHALFAAGPADGHMLRAAQQRVRHLVAEATNVDSWALLFPGWQAFL